MVRNRYKKFGWCVFLLTLVGQVACLFCGSEITLIADHLGQLAIASVISGENWKPLISETSYYGWGFNWLFSILFKLSDNPYFIFMVIELTFAIVNAMGSYFIYKTLSALYQNEKNNYAYIMLAIAAGITNARGYGSTSTVFFMICIISYTVAKLFLSSYHYKYSIILAVEGVYSISLHEKNLILFASITFCIVLWFSIEIKRNFRKYTYYVLVPYFATSTVSYAIFLALKKFVIANVWNQTEGNIKNSTIIRGNMFWFVDDFGKSIKGFLECFLSNLYTMINNTWGIGTVLVVIFIVILVKKVTCVFLRRNEENFTGIDAQYFIILMLGMTTMLIMAGLAFDGARGVCSGNYNNYVNWTYHRYYLCYAYVGSLFSLSFIEDKKIEKKCVISSLIIYSSLIIMFAAFEFPMLVEMQNKASRNLKSFLAWRIQTDIPEMNIKIAVFIVVIVLLLIKNHKYSFMGGIVLLLSLTSLNLEKFSFPYCEYCGSVYWIYDKIGMERLPDDIYTDSPARYTLQFMLNSKTVQRGIPSKDCQEAVYFSNTDSVEGITEEYVQIQLDEDEWIFVKGEKLIETINEVLEKKD